MPAGELHTPAVGHVESSPLGLVLSGRRLIADARGLTPAGEHSTTVSRSHLEDGLEKPRLVRVRTGDWLVVVQKERYEAEAS